MTSPLAQGDLDDLRADGLSPTDEDIIRLHALALRISSGPETTAANAPRWAYLGDIIIWEPTLAAWEWFEFAKAVLENENENIILAFACSLSKTRRAFEGLYSAPTAKSAVKSFRKNLDATPSELVRAIAYVAVGYNDIRPDPTPLALKRAEKNSEAEVSAYSAVESLLSEAAVTTGLTFDDIMFQTPSRLRAMIYEYHIQRGAQMSKTSAKAHADYLATLHNIRARLLAEKERQQS